MKPERIIVIAGPFDPISERCYLQIQFVKRMNDWVIAALHSDEWILRNKKKLNQPFEVRKSALLGVDGIDEVFAFNDSSNSYDELSKLIKICYPGAIISIYSTT